MQYIKNIFNLKNCHPFQKKKKNNGQFLNFSITTLVFLIFAYL